MYFHIAFPDDPSWRSAAWRCGISIHCVESTEQVAFASLDEGVARKKRVLHHLCDWAQDGYDDDIRAFWEAHPDELSRWPKFGFSRHEAALIDVCDALARAKPDSDLLPLGDGLWLHLLPAGARRTDRVFTVPEVEASDMSIEALADNSYRAEAGGPEIVGWWMSDQDQPAEIPDELFPPYG